MTRTVQVGLLVLSVLWAAPATPACVVPVFRYALENWQPEIFELAVLTPRSPTPEQTRLVQSLRELSLSGGGTGNFEVWEFSADQELPGWAANIRDKDSALKEPVVALVDLASSSEPVVVGRGTLEAKSLAALIDSPARQEIARGILTGAPFVWILVKGDNTQQNQEINKSVESAMELVRQEVIFPDAEEMLNDPLRPPRPMSPLPLQLTTAIVEIDPDDPRESPWLQNLYTWAPESRPAPGEPSLFVAFGQGRVIGPLTAAEVKEGALIELVRFLSGPCSCQIKTLNPGFDVVMTTDWNLAFDPNPDFSALGTLGHPVFGEVASKSGPVPVNEGNNPSLPMVVTLSGAALLLAALGVGWVVSKRKGRS